MPKAYPIIRFLFSVKIWEELVWDNSKIYFIREYIIELKLYIDEGSVVNMSKKLTHDEFIVRCRTSNVNVTPIGNYMGKTIKVKVMCNECGYMWEMTPHNIYRGKGCPECKKLNARKRLAKTKNQFIDELYKINNKVEVLGEYINTHTKIHVRCLIDGYEWNTEPAVLLSGHGCPCCMADKLSSTQVMPQNEFIDKMLVINKEIEILGEYINTRTKVKCRCKRCNHEWDSKANNLISGKGCPKCANVARAEFNKKTNDEFLLELKAFNENITALDEYKGIDTPIRFKCNIDGYEWETSPYILINFSRGCKRCNGYKGERAISKVLSMASIAYTTNKKYKGLIGVNGRRLSYDFYISDLNLLIEYNGRQHSEPVDIFGGDEQFKVQQEHDKRKREYAKKHGIELLEIWHWDFDNIETILNEKLNPRQEVI